jgi:hypothetical protein
MIYLARRAGLLSLASVFCLAPLAAHAQTVVRNIKTISVTRAGGLYTPNRAPLEPTAFMRLPIGSIKPSGWLRQQLTLDANGLPGRLAEVSDFLKFEGNGWVDPKSNTGWEELPYWLRGYGDLGYVLDDPKINADSKKWINGILSSQREDGWFGPNTARTSLEGGPDMWPHMLVLYVLQSYYDHTPDPRVLSFMTKYFRFQDTVAVTTFTKSWAGLRWADNLQAIYWLYNRTGDAFLLPLAHKIHDNSQDYTDNIPTWHNVNLAQGIREPAEYWLQAKDAKFLNATEDDYDKIMTRYGQMPGGVFAGDENSRPGYHDPRQGFETCGMVEYMNTFEIMTRITGSPLWSDRTEDIAFNSLPASMTPDHKGIHYITSDNSVDIDNQLKSHGQFQNDFPMQAYKPGIHDYRCCPHNYPMGWPYYAENLFLATADNGLCASLYAPSTVTAKAGEGAVPVTLTEKTDYPFGNTIQFNVAAPTAVRFPLYLRIPRWSEGASLKINGKAVATTATPQSYLAIDREWKSGDRVVLTLPEKVAVRTWAQNGNSVSVDYGPLTYSLAIQEKWQRDGGSDQWPEYAVHAATPWNYGLVLNAADPSKSFEVVRKTGAVPAQPFTLGTSPIELKAKARRIPNWQMDRDKVVETLQQSPVRSEQPAETVTLIPMGAARLRITSFPTIGGADAHKWVAPVKPAFSVTASHGHDDPDAPMAATTPAASGDTGAGRFTWWDHKGTPEWLEYDFTAPRSVSAVSVYWFDDTGKGECRVPASWRLLYKDGDAWKPVANPSEYATATDTFNRTSFNPVTTSALRLEVQLKAGVSGGVLRWKIESGAK